ncbi:MAG: ATP-binding protein, partial [Acidimicrobiia bacterium]|nr:ATP-binding protein [Acidimicrobiia bacterium]
IQIDERRPPGPKNTEDLFSILTEALRNAADHADASQITITGYVDREEGKLVVADNGKGFDPDSEYIGHFGLIGMKERARRIGASFKVESSVGAGTTISLEW